MERALVSVLGGAARRHLHHPTHWTLRTRRPPRHPRSKARRPQIWGIPAILAANCQHLVESGWTVWLSVAMLWCRIMDTVLAVLGPLSMILLLPARVRETAVRKPDQAG